MLPNQNRKASKSYACLEHWPNIKTITFKQKDKMNFQKTFDFELIKEKITLTGTRGYYGTEEDGTARTLFAKIFRFQINQINILAELVYQIRFRLNLLFKSFESKPTEAASIWL